MQNDFTKILFKYHFGMHPPTSFQKWSFAAVSIKDLGSFDRGFEASGSIT